MKTEWTGHGMYGEDDEVEYALDLLGMLPDEITALADHARREAALFEELSRHDTKNQKKLTEIAGWWQRRYRKWKALSAQVEQELTPPIKFPS